MAVSSSEKKKRFAMIERWHASGLSQVKFCKNESLPIWKFYKWRNMYKAENEKQTKPQGTGKFIKLSSPAPTLSGSVYAEVVFPGGTSIRFHQPIPSAELKQLAGL
jgi:hypothetical protein